MKKISLTDKDFENILNDIEQENNDGKKPIFKMLAKKEDMYETTEVVDICCPNCNKSMGTQVSKFDDVGFSDSTGYTSTKILITCQCGEKILFSSLGT